MPESKTSKDYTKNEVKDQFHEDPNKHEFFNYYKILFFRELFLNISKSGKAIPTFKIAVRPEMKINTF